MSYRDVEDLLAERGIDVSYETVRRWVLKFGDQQLYLWRAVDSEGEVLDILVQKRRNKRAALKLMRKLLKNQGVCPKQIVTDRLGSYGAALRELDLSHVHKMGGRSNNRAENSHLPVRRRERKMLRFKSQRSAQRFLSTHGPIYNLFNTQRHLITRPTLKTFRAQAMEEWNLVTKAA
jgi:transposase-like protein